MKKRILATLTGIVLSFCMIGCAAAQDTTEDSETMSSSVVENKEETSEAKSKNKKAENFITEIKTSDILFDNEVKTFKSDYQSFDIIGYSTDEKLIKSLTKYFNGDYRLTIDDEQHIERISIVVPKMKIYYQSYTVDTRTTDIYGSPTENFHYDEMEDCYPLAFIYDNCENVRVGKIDAFIYKDSIYCCNFYIGNSNTFENKLTNESYYVTGSLEPFVNAGVVEKPTTFVIE